MALSQVVKVSLAVSFFGALAFILGVIAENKKPEFGIPIQGQGVTICQYPRDPSILLGIFSIISLLITMLLGFLSVFYPYNGKSVPTAALFRSTTLLVFFTIAVGVTVMAQGMMIWVTTTEALYRSKNIHHNLEADCQTAKTGIYGGAGFLALDAGLFWLICQMLALNARADFLDGEEDSKGDYGQVLTAEYEAEGAAHPHPRV